MASKQYEQFSFQVGEVSPDYLYRMDLALRGRSLKTATNVRPRLSGQAESRPGSALVGTAPGDGALFAAVVGGISFFFLFTAARLDIYRQADRALVATLNGCPWDADAVPRISFDSFDDTVYVAHTSFKTQTIKRVVDMDWDRADLDFAAGINGTVRQPYYRYADKGVTVLPSGTAQGAVITLTTSAPYWDAQHVGKRVRLQNREVEISAVTDATHATGTVVQKLYPTINLPVLDSSGFQVGELVEGQDSGAKGEVVALPNGTTLTLLMQDFADFLYVAATDDTAEVTENVVGPNAETKNTGPVAATGSAPVLDWTEQAVSTLRGYPGVVAVHRDRLWLAGLTGVPFGILASAIGAFEDFEVATDDDAAIFEILRVANSGPIKHIVSAEQLLVITARKLFYYPESESNPIRPTSFQLLEIGPDGGGNAKPILTSEGVLYGAGGGGAITVAIATGDVRRSWNTANVTELCSHLIVFPQSLAYSDRVIGESERYAFVVNGNGDMTAITYSALGGQTPPGAAPWRTAGRYLAVASNGTECWTLTRRTYGGVKFQIEAIDPARWIDGAVDVTEDDYQGLATSQTITTPSGPMAADKVYRCATYAHATCALMIGGAYIGEVTLNADGDFGAPALEGDIELGFAYATECVPWSPLDSDDQRSRRRPRRITRASVRYQGRYMQVDGEMRASYDVGDDTGATPPARDELWQPVLFGGWSQEPTVTISKPYPAPWALYGLSLEVTS